MNISLSYKATSSKEFNIKTSPLYQSLISRKKLFQVLIYNYIWDFAGAESVWDSSNFQLVISKDAIKFQFFFQNLKPKLWDPDNSMKGIGARSLREGGGELGKLKTLTYSSN
jgi:hypothetical protein